MDKYKKLAKNTLIFSIGSFSSKILGILLVRIYTGFMSKGEFSTVTNIQYLVNLIGPIATLSIAEGILKYGLDEKTQKSKVYTSGVIVSILGMLAFTCLFPFIGLIKEFKPYISYMIVFLFTSEFRWVNQQFVKVKNYLRLYAIDSILSVVSLVVFSLLFLMGFDMGIKGYILALIMSDLSSIIFLIFFANLQDDLKIRQVDINLTKSMIQYTLPLIPTSVLWWVVSSSDSFMVSRLVSDEVNGVYAVAYKIPNLISLISIIFFRAWQMSAITEYNSKERRKFYTKVFDSYLSIMFVASAGIMFTIKILTKIIADKEYWGSYKMAPFLIIAVLLQSYCTFLSSIYNATSQNQNSLKTSFLAAIINIVLNIILIPFFGAQGAAFATMMAYFVCFIVRLVDTQRIAKYSISWRKIGTNLVVMLIMAIVILADFPLMSLWLFIGFAFITLINIGPIQNTVNMFLKKQSIGHNNI